MTEGREHLKANLMKRTEAIDRLKKSEAVFKKAGVKHLYLFGSTVRDEARPDSDVDLFFDYDPSEILGLYELMDIKELAAKILGAKTDMIPREGLHHVLRQRIEASAVQVF
jgi:predicted nucleotidyltransferase